MIFPAPLGLVESVHFHCLFQSQVNEGTKYSEQKKKTEQQNRLSTDMSSVQYSLWFVFCDPESETHSSDMVQYKLSIVF